MKKTYLCLLYLMASPLLAADDARLFDDERVLVQTEDDPRILMNWVRPIIQGGPQDQERLWVRAVWAESPISSDFGAKAAGPADRERAIRLGTSIGMHREALDLKLDLLRDQEEGDLQPGFLQLRREAHERQMPHVESRILREFAYWLYDRGDVQRSMQLQKESADLLDQSTVVSQVDRLRLKIDMAMVLDSEGQSMKARQLYREIEEQCRVLQLHAMCITNAHEMGLHYSSSKEATDWPTAEKYFEKSQRMALDFQDPWTIAKSQAALGKLFTQQHRYTEAIAIGLKAIEGFVPYHKDLWTGDAYKKIAGAYLGAKRYHEAVNALLKAQTLIPADFLIDQNEIHQLLAQCYEGLGDMARTIEHLKKHSETSKKLYQEREAREYSKATVDLGLRVEEERNKTLSAQNALQSQKLRDSEQLRWLLATSLTLATVALGSLLLAGYRSRQLRLGEMHMRRVLQQIQEGILSIDNRLLIQPGFSAYVRMIFGQDLVGKHILQDVLAQGPFTGDEIQTLQEVLSLSISEGALTWELNQHLLPVELVWRKDPLCILSLHWQPIFGDKGAIHAILLSFRDLTHQRELQDQVTFERQRHDRDIRCLQELMQLGPTKAGHVFQDTRDFLTAMPQLMRQNKGQELARHLHTLKGLARSFGLRDLAQAAHACEDVLQNPEDLQRGLEQFEQVIHEYLSLEPHVTGQTSQEKSLFSCVDHLLPSLRLRTEEHALGFQGVAARDQVQHWPERVMQKLDAIFVHAFNNAIDHGYVQPKQQGQVVEDVFIEVEAMEDRSGIHVTVRDYGHGIAWQKLRERARQLGRLHLSEQELSDLVFADGLSTTEQVSDTSGRGVGMSAVRSICEQLGGIAHFQANDRGHGAMLTMRFPSAVVSRESGNPAA